MGRVRVYAFDDQIVERIEKYSKMGQGGWQSLCELILTKQLGVVTMDLNEKATFDAGYRAALNDVRESTNGLEAERE